MSIALDCFLPGRPQSVREARSAMRKALQGVCDDDTLHELLIVTSELTTNAVEHAGSDFRLRVALERSEGGRTVVRVEVGDENPARPVVREAVVDEPGGRGLVLVGKLSERWGVEAAPRGKRVYAEVNC